MQRSRRTPGPQNRYAADLTKRVGAATEASPGSTGHAITAEHKRFSLHQELSTGLSARTVLVGIARIAVDGIAAGAYEILADNATRQAQAALAAGVSAL